MPTPSRSPDPLQDDPKAAEDVLPGQTRPGAGLAIGATATVPVKHIRWGAVELTVTGIRRGQTSDITTPVTSPGLREDAENDGDFWYVDVTITYVSGNIGGYYLDPDVRAVVRGGRQTHLWSMGNTFEPCTPQGLPLRPEPGQSVQDCVVFQASPGAEVTGLRWGPFETDYYFRGGRPISWEAQ